MQAADFLDDQDSLNRLCEHASDWVFEAPENIAERTVKRRKQSFADTYKSRALAASESRFQVCILWQDLFVRCVGCGLLSMAITLC